MLQIESLTVSYGANIVLNEISLQASKGEVHGIVGVNGSGKTTLLNTLADQVPRLQGNINWDDKPLTYKHLAYLESEHFFYSRLTGNDYLQLFKAKNPSFNIQTWNTLFELPLHQSIDDYSSGMKKKLALLAILSMEKPIFILDEPFNALDLESVETLKLIVQRLKQNDKLVLMTSHIIETLTETCDFIHHLVEGKILKTYSKPEFEGFKAQFFENQRIGIAHKINEVFGIN